VLRSQSGSDRDHYGGEFAAVVAGALHDRASTMKYFLLRLLRYLRAEFHAIEIKRKDGRVERAELREQVRRLPERG
jgi:hypothetical protein